MATSSTDGGCTFSDARLDVVSCFTSKVGYKGKDCTLRADGMGICSVWTDIVGK